MRPVGNQEFRLFLSRTYVWLPRHLPEVLAVLGRRESLVALQWRTIFRRYGDAQKHFDGHAVGANYWLLQGGARRERGPRFGYNSDRHRRKNCWRRKSLPANASDPAKYCDRSGACRGAPRGRGAHANLRDAHRGMGTNRPRAWGSIS